MAVCSENSVYRMLNWQISLLFGEKHCQYFCLYGSYLCDYEYDQSSILYFSQQQIVKYEPVYMCILTFLLMLFMPIIATENHICKSTFQTLNIRIIIILYVFVLLTFPFKNSYSNRRIDTQLCIKQKQKNLREGSFINNANCSHNYYRVMQLAT